MLKRLVKFTSIKQASNKKFTTWTPLCDIFNNRLTKPNCNAKQTGLFDISDLQSSEGFYNLQNQCRLQTDILISEATSNDRSRKMVEIFDELSDNLCRVADLAEFIRLAHPLQNYTKAAETTCGAVSGIVEELNTNRPLYDSLSWIIANGDKMETSFLDQQVGKLFLFDFEQSGIHLEETGRNKVVALNELVLQLGQQFISTASAPRAVKVNQLPRFVNHIFPMDGDRVVVSGLNADSENPLTRELAYRIYLYPDLKQDQILSELLQARYDLAIACGFKTYAHRTLNGSIVQTPEIAMAFLNSLSKNIKSRADNDFQIMSQMKSNDDNHNFATWDVHYYTQKYKEAKMNVSSSDYCPYFSLGSCMEGLNLLFNRLYGIQLKSNVMGKGESWSNDVYKLAVVHETEGLLGYIYCDFYERHGKPNQDCHFTIRGGKELSNGTYQLPLVVLMLNLPPARLSCPTLLTPGLVDNLFHEMGHAMHSMLARTKYQHVTGTRCTTDFAEVPSILMEYFARDYRVLRTFAKHFDTKEDIPEAMLRRLCASKHVFKASEMQMQLFYSTLDQFYHGQHPLSGTTTDILGKVQEEYYSLPYVKNTAWQLRFTHLVGYGAKYYSYLVSSALASWIWHSCFNSDPFNRTEGERYRRECLAHGGGKPASTLIADFLQKDPTPELLAESLIREIDANNVELEYVARKYHN